ncbi:hypothetical protein THAOC_36527 [Thalassiosira oceanica]|uniref:Atg6 BARA domain-containing protein n=1 Tax=Thalassiosira oceanica TaxID=159749 RepID=K0RED1_THAOC|nr:hypothetical protein THAOC_36527 [Thalassiosira oceanica]|eukprot:EJK44897.1 hypothetical protein THAOC_36527 [Thalassiosira oceanica]
MSASAVASDDDFEDLHLEFVNGHSNLNDDGGTTESDCRNAYEQVQNMDSYLEMLLSGGDVVPSLSGDECSQLAKAMDACRDQLDAECLAFEEATSAEEERALLMARAAISMPDLDGLNGDESEAILYAIESFQHELANLEHACLEQENELRTLQSLMHDQINRSDIIAEREKNLWQEWNDLEIDTHNFQEESHRISKKCSVVETEIQAIRDVHLLSLQFRIRAEWDENAKTGEGRYPTINDLRLAYRTNEKAGLKKRRSMLRFRMLPSSYPLQLDYIRMLGSIQRCDEGSSGPLSVPCQSLTLFLLMLSQLCDHVQTVNAERRSEPPYDMKDAKIDGVDVTKLEESDTASWSSVVFCLAANLKWLSETSMATLGPS